MSNTEIEIVVDDPTAPEPDSPPVADTRTVDVVVSLLLLALALTLGYDNWRTGISWDSTGPQAGYSFTIGGRNVELMLRGYKEFAAENRPEGWNIWVGLSFSRTHGSGK